MAETQVESRIITRALGHFGAQCTTPDSGLISRKLIPVPSPGKVLLPQSDEPLTLTGQCVTVQAAYAARKAPKPQRWLIGTR